MKNAEVQCLLVVISFRLIGITVTSNPQQTWRIPSKSCVLEWSIITLIWTIKINSHFSNLPNVNKCETVSFWKL